jgi:hypothetical protein
MGISSTETNLGLKKILEEKGITYSSGNTTNLSLRGLSTDGSGNDAADYFDEASSQYVNVDGTPNSTAPYGIGEFRGYSHISYTFNMRGSETSEPSICIEAKANSTDDSTTNFVTASCSTYMYAYYKSNGNIGITGVTGLDSAYGSFGSFRKWYNNSGTSSTLSGTNQMPEPGIEIANVSSGYTVRFEVDANAGFGGDGTGFAVTGSGMSGTFSNSTGDTYTHSGTASLPTQTSTQATNDQFPTGTRVRFQVTGITNPNDDVFIASLTCLPAFRMIFEKSGSPSFTVYTKGKNQVHASNTF